MKLFLSKKSMKRMKRAFFLFMAILFFCNSIFPSLGVARTSSPSVDDQIYISEGSRTEMEPIVAEPDSESHEGTEEEKLEYDPQPEKIEEVQGWIDKYLESDNDASEKPNWEKEVDEELMPDGWKTDFVEGGDEYFGKDYYTIFLDYDPQPEKIEEVRDWIKTYVESDNDESEKPNWEEEVDESIMPNGWEIEFIEDGDDHFDGDYYTFSVNYDLQPETIEEVRDQMKDYVKSDMDPSEKPNWEEEIDENIVPNGWIVEFVEEGDEHFEADYHTISVDYDSQPETIEEVREWIKKYLESDKDPSERPNWEKEVDEELMPDGWYNDLVEGGDEHFEADYYTIFQEDEEREEVAEEPEEEVEEEEEPEEETFEYDKQPETQEEVQEWVDKFIDSNYNRSAKPHWEFDVDKALMPNGWRTDFVEGGDEFFGLDFYTIFPKMTAMANFDSVDTEEKFIVAINNINGSAPGTHTINITGSFSLTQVYTITGLVDVTIQSVGGPFTITASSARHLKVENGAKLTLTNIVLDGGSKYDDAGIMTIQGSGGVEVSGSGTLTMDNGAIIQNCFAAQRGGGVYVMERSTFNLKGTAKIIQNASGAAGGGVYIGRLSTFNMNAGAKISENFTNDRGGGVAILQSYFNMNGGEISDNESKDKGGGVIVAFGVVNISGGSIIDNKTANQGGGLFVGKMEGELSLVEQAYTPPELKDDVGVITTNLFTMSGGTIAGNESLYSGGGVYVDGEAKGDSIVPSIFDMTGGTIEDNHATSNTPLNEVAAGEAGLEQLANGGGVAILRSEFNMSRTAKIDKNSATHIGGGVFVHDRSTVVMDDGAVISNNTTETWDGGILIHWKSTFIMNEGSKIINNTSVYNGGGVGIISSEFEMTGGLIAGNQTIAPDEDGVATGGGVMIGKSDIMDSTIHTITPSSFVMSGGQITGNHAVDAGGGVSIEDGSLFEMEGGTIGGDVPSDSGITPIQFKDEKGNIISDEGGNPITLTKGNMTGDRAGGVNVQDGSKFIMTGGAVKDNTTKDPTVTIITNNSDPAAHNYFSVGGGVMIDNKSTFTMEGANGKSPEVSGNSSYHHGGGVHVQGESKFYLKPGGIISDNTSHYSGGGVYVGYQNFVLNKTDENGQVIKDGKGDPIPDPGKMDGSVFTMTGGTIEGNNTEYLGKVAKRFLYGGGVHVDKATFHMNGGSIVNNLAAFSGGGVSIASGNFDMTGGNISGNITDISKNRPNLPDNQKATYGGGVWVGRSYYREGPDKVPLSEFNMSGDAIIGGDELFDKTANADNRNRGNYASESGGGVYISRGVIFNMYGDAKINFNHTDKRGGGVYTSHGSDWTSGTAEETGGLGSYKAERVPSRFYLNGKGVITKDEITGEETVKVTPQDGKPEIRGNVATKAGGGVYAGAGTVFHMYGGGANGDADGGAKITENSTQDRGGGVALLQCYFYMHGGEISNNRSVDRGGGLTNVYAIFEMTGGKIAGNETSNEAGGVYVGAQTGNASDFNLNQDYTPKELTDPNHKNYKGARHYFLLDGGTISNNTADNSGGGVAVDSGSLFEMKSGAITSNSTKTWSGGVNVWESTFNMTGGEISGNTSVESGGGLGIASAIFRMSADDLDNPPAISGNKTTSGDDKTSTAGGVWVGKSYTYDPKTTKAPAEVVAKDGISFFYMNDGKISGNYATDSGGGVFVEGASVFEMYDGTIGGTKLYDDTTASITEKGNKTEDFAGGVAIQQGYFTMIGGDIKGNTSFHNGGGVGLESAVFKMSGGTISGNETTWLDFTTVGNVKIIKDGAGAGGVWVSKVEDYDPATTVAPAEVKANGGISFFYMSGTSEISGNKARASGGGVSVEDGSLFEMSAGTIKSNTTEDAGGAVNVQQSSTFNMSGGTIKENKSEYTGAGVFVIDTNRYGDFNEKDYAPSTFNMSGGTIEGNQTTSTAALDQAGAAAAGVENLANGGGVAIIRSDFNMNGNATGKFTATNGPFPNGAGEPVITNNTAQHIGGGIFAHEDSTVYMYPGAEVSWNETKTWDGGILIHWNSKFYMHGGDITNNTSYFNGGGVGIISSEFYMYDGNIIGNSTTSSTDSTGGGVMIGGSDIVAGQLATDNPSYWEMHGGTIARNTAVNSGGGASIEDGSEFQMFGGVIGVSENEEPDIEDPAVEKKVRFSNGNSTDKYGGGVNVQDGSMFVMEDGSIRGNHSGSDVVRTGGGGVFVGMPQITDDANRPALTGTFVMNGGEISKNSSNRAGGGVYIHRNAEFLLNDGEIVDNRADSNIVTNINSKPDSSDGGGGVYVYKGKITMVNGVVSRNETWSINDHGATGGGIALLDTSTFTMEGGIISDNWASHGGGGVLLNENNTFNMYDGQIVRNIAEGGNETFMSGGGGVYLFRRNWFNMYDGKINENIAGKNGGGVAVNYPQFGGDYDSSNDSVINMYGGEINNNRVEGRNLHANQGYGGGGGVYIYQGATFNMIKQVGKEAPEIKNNTAGLGGGVGVEVGKEVQGSFGTNGGGIYVSRGTLNITSGIIEGNTAVGNGGGIYVREANAGATNIVKINDPGTDGDALVDQGIDPGINPDFGSNSFITHNTAGGDGGGIYVAAAYNLYNPEGYEQLKTGETTVFEENKASTLYNPPGDYPDNGYKSLDGETYYTKDYPEINFDDDYVSERDLIKTIHPLNNYDINFRNPPAISVFTFFKVDAAEETKKLEHAEFQLYYEEGGVKYYYYDIEDYSKGSIIWLKQEADGTFKEYDGENSKWIPTGKSPNQVSSSNGQVAFPNLPEGDYTLVEVKAPDGYQLPTGYWSFTWEVIEVQIGVDVDGDGVVDEIDVKEIGRIQEDSIQVEGTAPAFKNVGTKDNQIYYLGNIKNFQLPLTGNGGYWLMALGLLLLALGLGRVLYKKYKDKQNSPSELEKNIE